MAAQSKKSKCFQDGHILVHDAEDGEGSEDEGAHIAEHAEQRHAQKLRLHVRGTQNGRAQKQPRRQQRQRQAPH